MKLTIDKVVVLAEAVRRAAREIGLSAEEFRRMARLVAAMYPRRIRTGVAPRRGRSRRKQRLTRLQRRAKRQRN